MFTKTKKAAAWSMAFAAFAGISAVDGGVNSALAQGVPDEELEEIVVTGSLIPRKDLSGPSPVTVFDRESITQSGATSIGQMLREIPAVAGQAQSTNINNGGFGAQNISLRGLGSQRTLVLINGRRAPDSTGGNDGVVDLNTIPIAMVERVEILKDGASAIYGSDAIAGAVNLVMRKDFEGMEFYVQTGQSGESDGEKHEFSIVAGNSFEGGNFIMSISRIEEAETIAGNRDWARQAFGIVDGEWRTQGSSAVPWARATLETGRNAMVETDSNGQLRTGGTGTGTCEVKYETEVVNDAEGEPRFHPGTMEPVLQFKMKDGERIPVKETKGYTLGPDYAGAGANAMNRVGVDNTATESNPCDFNDSVVGGLREFTADDTYNYAPVNFQRQPNERWIINALASTRVDTFSDIGIFDSTRIFGEVNYIDRESSYALAEQPMAPLAFYGFSAPYSKDNEYNPTGQDINDWRRRFVEDGPRTGLDEVRTFRGVVGMEGDLAGNWSWTFYGNYSEVDRSNDYGPMFDLNKVKLAVGPTVRDSDEKVRCDTDDTRDADGNRVFDDSKDDAACVPLDIFGQGSITSDMVNYISFRQLETNKVQQRVVEFNITKPDVFELPGGDVGFAAGFLQRKESGKFKPDGLVAALAETGAVTGTPSDITDGSYTVDELFLEFRVPALESLEVDLGFRYSDYDSFGDTSNWKLGVQYRPIDDLLLRGSAGTSFRAPSIQELYGGAGISFPSISDPCNENPTQFCLNDGVPAGGFEPISMQIRTQIGGNQQTKPEEADSFTLGAVYQPYQFPGVAVALDYYNVSIENPITQVGAQLILTQCKETGSFCEKIERFPEGDNHGNPKLVDNRTTNAGKLETSGIDLLAEWQGIESNFGTFGVRWEASLLLEYDKTGADGKVVPHDGFFRDDADGHFAELKFTLSGLYERGGLSARLDYRWIDKVREFGGSGCWSNSKMEVTQEGVNVGLTCVTASSPYAANDLGKFTREIDSIGYIDVHANYVFNENVNVFVGIDNLLDEDPPLSVDGFNDNTDVRTFDTIGRYMYLGLRTHF